MKTPYYQEKLKELAPNVVFSLSWSPDHDGRWDKTWGDQNDFECLNADFSAKAIVGGVEVEGNAYLGECWEKYGERDPEVGGYLPQKLQEAANELFKLVPEDAEALRKELFAVDRYLKEIMQQRWEDQQMSKT